MASPHTVVELESFLKRAKAIMSDEERLEIVLFLAANPEAGVLLGGGLRKVRIAREGSGKSGGYRTLYVFGGNRMPLFLMTVYAKNEKSNLTKKELEVAIALSKELIATYGGEV